MWAFSKHNLKLNGRWIQVSALTCWLYKEQVFLYKPLTYTQTQAKVQYLLTKQRGISVTGSATAKTLPTSFPAVQANVKSLWANIYGPNVHTVRQGWNKYHSLKILHYK